MRRMARALGALTLTFTLSAASQSWACGGLFCNTAQPVNQAAERILFVVDEGVTHMHVQIRYQGPPTDFGWLLPVPPGVEVDLSSEQLFTLLDQNHGPIFTTRTETHGCEDEFGVGGAGSDGVALDEAPSATEQEGGRNGVQVISREAVGPYDRVIIQADSVEDLRAWLDENEFQIPQATDEKLQPYLEMGTWFVAIKLLEGNDAGDIVPLRLRFDGDRPAIPIIPTAVAAEPDMGVIVHLLGAHRAVPTNYLHVTVNDAAIDWFNNGSNYADVVSQAADEAGGRAFATDYAGPLNGNIQPQLQPVDERTLARLDEAQVGTDLFDARLNLADADIIRVIRGAFMIPEGYDEEEFYNCLGCFEDFNEIRFDGAMVAERIRIEVNPVRELLDGQLGRFDYLTRLYSTLSAAEMIEDPIFSFNPDLPEVMQTRTAVNHVYCDGRQGHLELPDGRRIESDAPQIIRQEGETVRGAEISGASSIEALPEAGQAELISAPEDLNEQPGVLPPEVVAELEMPVNPNRGGSAGSVGTGNDEGCSAAASSSAGLWLLCLLIGFPKRRRRAR